MQWIGSTYSPIGLDCGSRFIKAAQIQYTRGKPRVCATASIQRMSEQLDVAEVNRISDVLYRQGFVGTRIAMAVPPAKILTSILELPPRTTNSPFDQLARVEFARHQKCEPNTFEMSWWELPHASRVAKTTSVMAVGCRYTDADAILDPFDAVGLDVLKLDSSSVATARACSNVLARQGGISAILDLGWRSASLVILHDQTIVYDRPLGEAGIEQLYKDLSSSLGVKFDVIDVLISQQTKLSSENDGDMQAQREITRAIDNHFAMLLKDLELSFSYAANQYASTNIDRLLLMGGGASIPGLVKNWSENLGMKVEIVHLADLMPCVKGMASSERSSMTTALGLAMGGTA
jgi:Tfp pilus assembly PilM family ATPase